MASLDNYYSTSNLTAINNIRSNLEFNFIINMDNSTTVTMANINSSTVTTIDQEIEPLPFTSKVILVVMYAFITVAAVVGNSLAIIVFAQGKRSKTDLRPFLINLAVADLIMAIFCIPFTFSYQITNHWVFSKPMCFIVQSCQLVSVTASVCTNTCIGIDRLIAVKCPLRKRVTNSKSKVVIVFVWILALCMGVFPLVTGKTREVGGKITCEEKFPDNQIKLAYTFFVMIVTYFLPVTILTVTYSMISHQLWNRSIPGQSDDTRDAHQLRSKRKVVKMLSTVVLLFGVCWLPLHLFFIMFSFNPKVFGDAANAIYFGVHWLSMSNSFVNPVIYGFMNDNFRADLRNLCQACWCHQGQHVIINRSPALRWRSGHNVHDSFPSDNHQLQHNRQPYKDHHPPITTTNSLLRNDLEMKAATKPMLWENGRAKTCLGLKTNSGGVGCGGNGEDVCDSNNSSMHNLNNSKLKSRIWRPKVREVNKHGDKLQVRYGLVQNGAHDDVFCDSGGCSGRDRHNAVSTCNGRDASGIDMALSNGVSHKPQIFRSHRLS